MYVHKHAVNNLYTASLRKVKKITERYWHLSHSIHGQSQDPKNQSVPGNRYNISLRSLSSYVNLHCWNVKSKDSTRLSFPLLC